MAEEWYPITNDQVFKHVFGRNHELCRRLIELALDTPIANVMFVESQHESTEARMAGSAYFDVLATTSTGDLIDVEMQKSKWGNLAKRAKLYLSRLAVEAWRNRPKQTKVSPYASLPSTAVIFVCDFDPFGKNLRRYTYLNTCRETGEVADDGAMTVFLNARGSDGNVSPELAGFLTYMGNGKVPAGNSFVQTVDRHVAMTNHDAEFLEGLMNMEEKLWWSRQDGLEEGLEEGRKEGRSEVARLVACLTADGRAEELANVLQDDVRLDQELKRYGIESELGDNAERSQPPEQP